MKKILLATILIIVICISGCTKGSYTFITSNENSGDDFWNASYENFNGYKQREMTITGDGTLTFLVEIVTNSGSLSLSIADSEGRPSAYAPELQSSSFEVIVSGEEKYIVRFDADNHQGSFNIKLV